MHFYTLDTNNKRGKFTFFPNKPSSFSLSAKSLVFVPQFFATFFSHLLCIDILQAAHTQTDKIVIMTTDNSSNNNNNNNNEFFGYGILHCSGPQNQCPRAMTERGAFFFSGYPWLCSTTTQFCCTKVSKESTIRTSSSSRFFVLISSLFNPWDLYYRGYKKI